MQINPDLLCFLIYFVVFMAIQTIILMGYIDLRRKHNQLKEKVEKMQEELDLMKK